ncbi:MAG TPA: hypothetical protein VEI02_02050 [Planctomycetota bacterium]|nr:hypothetical protein [Planctomycetota bacterium]
MRRTTLSLLALACALAPAQQPNTLAATMKIDGNDGPVYPMFVNVRTNTVSTITIDSGIQFRPFLIAASATGNLQPFAAVVFGDKMDIPYNPAPVIFMNGFLGNSGNPATTPNVTPFQTNAFGVYNYNVSIPGTIAINSTAAFQAVVGDPGSVAGYNLTAATKTTMTQGPTVTTHSLGDSGSALISLPTGFQFPFYGSNYSNLWIYADGCFTMNTSVSDFSSSPAQFTGGPPRIMGFWTDLDQQTGVIRSTVDANPPGDFPYARVEFINVTDWSGIGFLHTFSWEVNNQGRVLITQAINCNASIYETMVGIGPGNNINSGVAMKNLSNIVTTPPFSHSGGVNENFYEWFGLTTMPSYSLGINNPYDLPGYTLTFLPIGSGATLVATTTQYIMF